MSGYISIKATGVEVIDNILNTLERCGDEYHHTEQWIEYDDGPSCLDRIEAAAKEAAARIEQLEAEAKTRTLDYLGQVGQLSEELERVKREAERAQDAHGVRFLNYLEETARLTDRIERLEAALRSLLEASERHIFSTECQVERDAARAALEDK